MYERLPFCLEAMQVAYRDPTVTNRVHALDECVKTQLHVVPGKSYENIETRVSADDVLKIRGSPSVV